MVSQRSNRRQQAAALGSSSPRGGMRSSDKSIDIQEHRRCECCNSDFGNVLCYCCTRAALDDFMQQRMRAWQPVLSPKKILYILFLATVLFMSVGIFLTIINNNLVECRVSYSTDPNSLETVITIDASTCSDTSVTEIKGDIYVFYELTNFYQNHRRYLKSRSDSQMQGTVYTDASSVSVACDPRVTSADGRVLHPCGLNAASIFSDEYTVYTNSSLTEEIPMDESRDTICWSHDLGSTFRNPSAEDMEKYKSQVNFWLYEPYYRKLLHMDKPGVGEGVENSHLIVWMREAALPTLRKAYGKLMISPVKLPFYIKISNNTFDVQSFRGTKSVVVSQAEWIGTRNSFMGTAYLLVGSVCLVLFLILLYFHIRNPRRLGDVSWLRKALYANN